MEQSESDQFVAQLRQALDFLTSHGFVKAVDAVYEQLNPEGDEQLQAEEGTPDADADESGAAADVGPGQADADEEEACGAPYRSRSAPIGSR
jgi:hypothetical protein